MSRSEVGEKENRDGELMSKRGRGKEKMDINEEHAGN